LQPIASALPRRRLELQLERDATRGIPIVENREMSPRIPWRIARLARAAPSAKRPFGPGE